MVKLTAEAQHAVLALHINTHSCIFCIHTDRQTDPVTLWQLTFLNSTVTSLRCLRIVCKKREDKTQLTSIFQHNKSGDIHRCSLLYSQTHSSDSLSTRILATTLACPSKSLTGFSSHRGSKKQQEQMACTWGCLATTKNKDTKRLSLRQPQSPAVTQLQRLHNVEHVGIMHASATQDYTPWRLATKKSVYCMWFLGRGVT